MNLLSCTYWRLTIKMCTLNSAFDILNKFFSHCNRTRKHRFAFSHKCPFLFPHFCIDLFLADKLKRKHCVYWTGTTLYLNSHVCVCNAHVRLDTSAHSKKLFSCSVNFVRSCGLLEGAVRYNLFSPFRTAAPHTTRSYRAPRQQLWTSLDIYLKYLHPLVFRASWYPWFL